MAQLCRRLGVTRTAVQVQLRQLQAEGLVQPVTGERSGLVGKPAVVYEAAAGNEDLHSRAYLPFLASLMTVLRDRFEPDVLIDALEETGRRMAQEAGLADPANFESGLRAAMAAADSLGANTEVEPQESGVMVRNYSCPLATAIRAEGCLCRAIAAFFSEATGQPVKEQCLRGERLTCQYLIDSDEEPRMLRPR